MSRLYITNCLIEENDIGHLQSLSGSHQTVTLDIEYTKFYSNHKLPKNFLRNSNYIDGKLSIVNVEFVDFQLSDFTTNDQFCSMIFINNSIKYIGRNTFGRPLDILYVLEIKRNLITVIAADTFRNLEKLSFLNLEQNLIHKLEANSFRGLNFLRKLNLNHNKLTSLESTLFIPLKALQKLSLQYNLFTSIDRTTFKFLTNVRFLELGNNQITFIDDDFFHQLKDVRNIYINQNNLIEFPR